MSTATARQDIATAKAGVAQLDAWVARGMAGLPPNITEDERLAVKHALSAWLVVAYRTLDQATSLASANPNQAARLARAVGGAATQVRPYLLRVAHVRTLSSWLADRARSWVATTQARVDTVVRDGMRTVESTMTGLPVLAVLGLLLILLRGGRR